MLRSLNGVGTRWCEGPGAAAASGDRRGGPLRPVQDGVEQHGPLSLVAECATRPGSSVCVDGVRVQVSANVAGAVPNSATVTDNMWFTAHVAFLCQYGNRGPAVVGHLLRCQKLVESDWSGTDRHGRHPFIRFLAVPGGCVPSQCRELNIH